MFSSASEDWETPQSLFDQLNEKYHFTLDVCASHENKKCERYFSKDQDGLKQAWSGVCWCKPPYGRKIAEWIEKAVKSNATVVMLLPARTDTKWFHEWVLPYGEITFLRGRLKFNEKTNKNPAPFPSMIVVFKDGVYESKCSESKNEHTESCSLGMEKSDR